MEIKEIGKFEEARSSFKIDLIVWKFDIVFIIYINNMQFKIDLIVWKFREDSYSGSWDNLFKIDLIVWK